MALPVKPTPLAVQQIRQEANWWRRNRTQAPRMFREELRSAFQLVAEYPDAGTLAEDIELPNVRRVLLAGTQHYVYYRRNESAGRIEILAVWSTSRGSPPVIR
ncbi:MAG: type II toxin-antitoxin system RelE/ParE family toxin [Thermoanaerobaculia bacterium]